MSARWRRRILHRDDAEGVVLAVMLGDGHVFTGLERVAAEPIDRLVVVLARRVGKRAAACGMDELSQLVVGIRRETANRATLRRCLVCPLVEAAVRSERRVEDITVTGISRRKPGRACQLEPYLLHRNPPLT